LPITSELTNQSARKALFTGVVYTNSCHFEQFYSKAKFSFFTSLSAAEAHVFGVKFIGLCGTVVFVGFGTFPFEEKANCGVTSGQRWMEWSAFPFF